MCTCITCCWQYIKIPNYLFKKQDCFPAPLIIYITFFWPRCIFIQYSTSQNLVILQIGVNIFKINISFSIWSYNLYSMWYILNDTLLNFQLMTSPEDSVSYFCDIYIYIYIFRFWFIGDSIGLLVLIKSSVSYENISPTFFFLYFS